jgi:hypothetical protein
MVASDGSGVYGRKFVPNDVGRTVSDTDGYVWPDTTITEVLDDGVSNTARLSQRFTPQGIGTAQIIDYTLSALPSDVYYSATANFAAADVGHVISGTNIPTGTRIMAVTNAQYVRLSQRPTAISTALLWTVAQEVSFVFTSSSGVFQSSDVGSALRAPAVLDGDATITKFISATQVELDKRPDSAEVGVQWTVIPARPYPPASVSRLISGSVGAQEVQKIALAQSAIGGTLAIQDGYGGPMPVAVMNNPVNTSDLQIALKQAYSNYGDLSVQEVIPGAEWNVIFGKRGGQRLLLVSETQAIYGDTVLSWIVANKSAMIPDIPIPQPPTLPLVTRRNGLIYIGADPDNLSGYFPVGQPRISRTTDGTDALIMNWRIMAFTDKYVPPGMNGTIPFNRNTYYFVGEQGGQDKNGLYTVDWVAATKPASRTEVHNQQRTIMFPLYQKRGTVILDVQLVSTSASTWVQVNFDYYLEGSPPAIPMDGPIGVVIHYSTVGGVEFPPVLWAQNGFSPDVGNWRLYFITSWSRRRWMGHIWEQKVLYN